MNYVRKQLVIKTVIIAKKYQIYKSNLLGLIKISSKMVLAIKLLKQELNTC